MAGAGKTVIRDPDSVRPASHARVRDHRLWVDIGSVVIEEDDVESKSFFLLTPAAGATKYGIWVPNRTTTISEINSYVAGSGGPSVDWSLRHDADPSAAGTEVITGGGTTSATSSIDVVTSFNNPVLISGRLLWFTVDAVTGTVSLIHMTVHFDRTL